MVPIGEELSRGVELDVTGKILPYWSVMASYSYNVAEITKAADGTRTSTSSALVRPVIRQTSGRSSSSLKVHLKALVSASVCMV